MDNAANGRIKILHDAVNMLALPADEQLSAFRGMVVADELALDFDNAFGILDVMRSDDGAAMGADLLELLTRLNGLMSAPSDSDFWSDEALATHPTWQEGCVKPHERSSHSCQLAHRCHYRAAQA